LLKAKVSENCTSIVAISAGNPLLKSFEKICVEYPRTFMIYLDEWLKLLDNKSFTIPIETYNQEIYRRSVLMITTIGWKKTPPTSLLSPISSFLLGGINGKLKILRNRRI